MRAYRYSVVVGFQDTNLVGNVYFAQYFGWQGKCRENFLRDHAPQILDDFRAGFGMITRGAECRFTREAWAFDQIDIEMYLEQLTPLGVTMRFEYYRQEPAGPVLLAEGSQSTMWVNADHRPCMMPEYLHRAIRGFADAEEDAPSVRPRLAPEVA